jgi:hypothetical protein
MRALKATNPTREQVRSDIATVTVRWLHGRPFD